jgi:hypothetical protein
MHEPSDSSRKKIYSFGEPVAERKQFCINVETAVPSRLIVIFREVRFDSRIEPERRAMARNSSMYQHFAIVILVDDTKSYDASSVSGRTFVAQFIQA